MIEVPFVEAQATFEKLSKDKKSFVAIFTSEKDINGETWCPDCKAAAPLWPEVVERAKGKDMSVYVFYVGPREQYKTPEHPFRTHNLIKLKCIPTLGWYDGNTISKKLQEG